MLETVPSFVDSDLTVMEGVLRRHLRMAMGRCKSCMSRTGDISLGIGKIWHSRLKRSIEIEAHACYTAT